MTTEHVSMTRDELECIRASIKAGMNDVLEDIDAILSRATPSDEKLLPVVIYGKVYDVPIPVQLHIVSLTMQLEEAKQSAPHVVTEPLSVFSGGMWTWNETGQSFTKAEMDEAAFIVYRDHAESFATSLPAAVPDGIADALLDAWRSIAHVSGSALLSGEKKAQTSEQRELVYGMACNALITIGNAYYELTEKNPDFAAAPQAEKT